jgi:hypothetical protein
MNPIATTSLDHAIMIPVSMDLKTGFLAGNGDGGDVLKSNLHSRGVQDQLAT